MSTIIRQPRPSRGLDRRNFCTALAGAAAVAATRGAPARAEAVAQPLPNGLVGAMRRHTARHEDTLLDLARTYNLGYTEIVAANRGVDPWLPGAGTEVVLPDAHLLANAPRRGLVLNLADQRLYLFDDAGEAVETVPIGIGAEGRLTPLGTTRIVNKRKNPTWYVPDSIRQRRPELPKVVPPGPDNPLGTRAFYLDWPSYLIHGTHMPYGVGRRVSSGCIRLYPEDVERLYDKIAVGTPVTVVDQPLKVGWSEGSLLVEVHPDQEQADELEQTGAFTPSLPPDLVNRVAEVAGPHARKVDWTLVRHIAVERRGYPIAVLKEETAAASQT